MLPHIKFGSPASRTALEHVAVVQQAVEHGADGGRFQVPTGGFTTDAGGFLDLPQRPAQPSQC